MWPAEQLFGVHPTKNRLGDRLFGRLGSLDSAQKKKTENPNPHIYRRPNRKSMEKAKTCMVSHGFTLLRSSIWGHSKMFPWSSVMGPVRVTSRTISARVTLRSNGVQNERNSQGATAISCHLFIRYYLMNRWHEMAYIKSVMGISTPKVIASEPTSIPTTYRPHLDLFRPPTDPTATANRSERCR